MSDFVFKDSDLDVGARKPLGYIPLSTLRLRGVDAYALWLELIHDRRKIARIATERESGIDSGALFAGDPFALADVTYQHAETLNRFGIPVDPWRFVMWVIQTGRSYYLNGCDPEVERIVGLAFADSRFTRKGG